jgi:3-oxoacyl-[acyl-carrier protein] reductase
MKSNIQSKLAGKTALVTGASKGIGASIAKHLAAAGASVVVNYASSKAGADQVVAEIIAAGGRAVAIQGDVAKPADITRLFAETKKAFGGLDILVNNAGVYEFLPLEAITAEHYHRLFNINVLGLLLTTQEAVKYFPASGGSVINVGSVVTDLMMPGSAVYTATKGAVDVITGVLAKELGPKNIRVNALNPGLTITEGTHTAGIAGSDFERNAVSKTPLGRAGQPQDIAKAAVFLASDDSGWVTGEQLRVGGGIY